MTTGFDSKVRVARGGVAPNGWLERFFGEVVAALAQTARTPLGTYRLQLHRGFGFLAARAVIPYLWRLGISDLYASPVLKATPGSTHGYDVTDPSKLNPECGSEDELSALCTTLGERGMGLLLDVVPNHMGIERDNPLWWDVLENGPAALCAPVFDIDWDPVKEELRDKVLLPILGDMYGAVLERGELKLTYRAGGFELCYHEHRFPIAPRRYPDLLRPNLEALEAKLGSADPDFIELQSILTALSHLPPRTLLEPGARLERAREKEVIKRRLEALTARREDIRVHILSNLVVFNGRPEDARSFDALDRLLEGCSYRLAHWRVAGEEINYRRFFDINTLAAVRVEDPAVFAQSHGTVFRLLEDGRVTGLRIDHPDGLFDPAAYFLALQEEHFLQTARSLARSRGSLLPVAELETWLRSRYRAEHARNPGAALFRSLYVVVEKIQGGKERIPESWAVHGTTGYRFANAVTGLFVDPAAEKAFTQTYERFIGRSVDFEALVYEKKRLILSVSMSSEVNVLARELNRISELNRRTRDFTLNSLRRALVEFIARFPVYRTYVDGLRPQPDARDVQYVEWTVAEAKRQDPVVSASIYDFLRDILLRRYPEHVGEEERAQMLRFAMKLQQLTGPVMAKGLEDTAFYLYNRFVALNEVGGEPERFGTSPETFHLRNQERAESFPSALLCTSTHDTKRSEDVRARLCVLSELPEVWTASARKFARVNRRHKGRWHGGLGPTANDEYLYYQTLLGVWPMGGVMDPDSHGSLLQRVDAYMQKAIKEAKAHTSWTHPDLEYEEAVRHFVHRTLDKKNASFLEDLRTLGEKLETPGMVNALAQVLLKVASPGTPDIYQGTELWDLSLVDPDNRREVDFLLREQLLEALDDARERQGPEALCEVLWENRVDGRIKLYTLAQALRLRQRFPQLFRLGAYHPLGLVGPEAGRALGLCRAWEDTLAVAVVPRLMARILLEGRGLSASLQGTKLVLPASLEGCELQDVYTGRTLRPVREEELVVLDMGEVFRIFPVALLWGTVAS